MEQKVVKKRKYYIDIIKIVCIYNVCFGHSGPTGFLAYETATGLTQAIMLAYSTFIRVGIPLFFMCTGALLLTREEPIKDLWVKRILKYMFITVFFTLVYYIVLSVRNNTPIDIPFILKTVYSTWGYSHSGSYWFLYSYIAFLILLPFLRLIARGLNKHLVWYMIIVNTVVCGVLPLLEASLGMEDWGVDISLITLDVFFYPFMGYYIEKAPVEEICNKKNLIVCFVMTVISILSCVKYTIETMLYKGYSTQEFMGVFQLYVAFLIYIGAKMLNEKIKIEGRLAKVITEIAMCTFGIYLIHGIVYIGVDDFLMAKGVPFTYLVAKMRGAIVFVISLVIVWICRRIPFIKKLF